METPAPDTNTPPTSPADAQAATPDKQQVFPAEHVAELRAENASWRKKAQENAAAAEELAKIKDAQKSEIERAQEAATAAQKQAEEANLRALRYEVGVAAGLPAEAIGRLQGATKEELAADAEALKKLVTPGTPPAPSTRPQSALVSGSVSPQNQTPQDPNAWLRDAIAAKGRK